MVHCVLLVSQLTNRNLVVDNKYSKHWSW